MPGRRTAATASATLGGAPAPDVRGVRAGVVVFAGIAAANLGNYVFHLVAGRSLGPATYGDVASLVALIGFFSLPLVGLQVATARFVADFAARGDDDAVATFFTRSAAIGLVAAGAMAAVLLLGAAPLQRVLDIESRAAVVLAVAVVVPSVLTPICWGVAQGLQRFALFSASIALGPFVRLLVLAAAVASGAGVAAAMGATLAGAVASLALPAWFLRNRVGRRSARLSPETARAVRRYLVPVVVGVLALTSLTTADVMVAKAALPDDEAGLYGGASLVGRVILYLPAAVVVVLLPKVSARTASGRSSVDALLKSLAVTGLFCLGAIAVYAAVPKLVLFVAFGPEFEAASGWLWMFAVAMTGFSMLNVMLAYYLGRGESIASWLLLGGAILQAALFAVFHDSAEELLLVDIAVAAVLTTVQVPLVWRSLADRGGTRAAAGATARARG